jgi:hypothetical protein
MKTLSAWLQLMLAEIARKRDEAEREHAEQTRRAAEQAPAPAPDAVQRHAAAVRDAAQCAKVVRALDPERGA